MVLVVTMRNYFNFSGIMTQFVYISKNLSLILVFSRLLEVIPLSHPRFVPRMGEVVLAFCSTSRCMGRRFSPVSRYMQWLFVFIFVRSILFTPCICLLVCQLRGMIWLNCSVNSRSPSLFNISHLSWGDTVVSPNTVILLSVTSEFSLF